MAKKPISFEKVRTTLTTLVKEVEEAYDQCVERQYETTGEARAWAKADKAKYDYLHDALYEIIYRLEDWQQI